MKELQEIANNERIAILSGQDENMEDIFMGNIGPVFKMDDSFDKSMCIDIAEIINESNNLKEIVFVNYNRYYRDVIPGIKKGKKITWIITHSVASLTDPKLNIIFKNIMEFYSRGHIDCIGCTDMGLYELLLKKGYCAQLVKLAYNSDTTDYYEDSGSIGILSDDYDPKHGLYNMLTALKLVDYENVKLISTMPATKHFLEFFSLKYSICNNIDEVMKNNFVNLYCNFTNSDEFVIIKSMDMGIPCIVGNCNMFNEYPLLKKYLVLLSDDDVNEIAEKISNVRQHMKEIFKEYEKFRHKYIEKSQ